jgi:hypothetical protein
MTSGRQALAQIDRAVTEARTSFTEVQARIESIEQAIAAQRLVQAEDYKALARVRIGQLDEQGLVHRLEQAEQNAAVFLAQRHAALSQLEQQIQVATAGLVDLEAERAAQATRVDEAAQAVDAAEAVTQERLGSDSAYRAQRARATEAERHASHAAEKAARSEEEREEKGASYRQDLLFMYLWNRRYGTAEYKAWPLTRWLDGKVARLVGYLDAGLNYQRLSDIPERLREHAAALAAAADAELASLKALDEAARTADGIPALESRLAEEQAGLDAIDQRLVQAESDLAALQERRVAYSEGRDDYSIKALDAMAEALQREDLMELRREALATPFPEDDVIVARLLEREDEQRRQDAALQALRETLAQHQQRLEQAKALRDDFKRQRYDRAGSEFGDEAQLGLILGQFLNGILDRQNLWRILQEQQRYRPQRSDVDFGSGGFGRGTVWGGGLGDLRRTGGEGGFPRGSGGAGRIPGGFSQGGGRSRGGFRTGGGF